jgi:hypothetical protein
LFQSQLPAHSPHYGHRNGIHHRHTRKHVRPAAIEPYDVKATTRATLRAQSARLCRSCPPSESRRTGDQVIAFLFQTGLIALVEFRNWRWQHAVGRRLKLTARSDQRERPRFATERGYSNSAYRHFFRASNNGFIRGQKLGRIRSVFPPKHFPNSFSSN